MVSHCCLASIVVLVLVQTKYYINAQSIINIIVFVIVVNDTAIVTIQLL